MPVIMQWGSNATQEEFLPEGPVRADRIDRQTGSVEIDSGGVAIIILFGGGLRGRRSSTAQHPGCVANFMLAAPHKLDSGTR